MARSGPLWRKGDCLTEMNVVYRFADCSTLLPDNSSHPPLNFILAFLEATAPLADQVICDTFIRSAAAEANRRQDPVQTNIVLHHRSFILCVIPCGIISK